MRRLVTWVLLAAAVTGCVTVEPHERRRDREPAYAPNVPKGHMPPPGSCRVWHPGRPPGHQPPPGPCDRLQYEVPPGAYLIRG